MTVIQCTFRRSAQQAAQGSAIIAEFPTTWDAATATHQSGLVATITPATAIELGCDRGSLSIGKRAD
ncbi:hypothetical protein [Acaryochloris sp. IP29b_bin.137]|uniref:hypothetical protein n=1 Tax=Acaryochloris sp. IP29b_bin.137 TaxID=2969217 RepID=UPI002605C25E|nr:hypothetical protein [Acaryochloris sp. IP29b_bin.137]